MNQTAEGCLARRGEAALMQTYARFPVELVSGSGVRVVDAEGRQYLDFTAGIAVTALGHGHPALVEAMRAAADGLIHVSNLYWTEPMVRLAERLARAAEMERVFFCNSGAEAVEAAIKLARRARPGRPRIISCERSFHGRTTGALALTWQERYQAPFRPLLPGAEPVPFGDAEALDATLDQRVAAVVVEPIQGEGGVRPAPAGWLAHLRRRCDECGALLVLDEVQTGVGRTGTFFAYQAEGVLPDVVAVAKGLAGGLPMGAILARGEAAGAFRPGDHASTFGGGPFVATVANALLDVVLAPGFLDAVRARGERLAARLGRLVERQPLAAGVRGRGLMLGLVLAEPRAGDLAGALIDLGLLACPAGADVLRLVPPLTIGDEEIDEGVRRIERGLARLAA